MYIYIHTHTCRVSINLLLKRAASQVNNNLWCLYAGGGDICMRNPPWRDQLSAWPLPALTLSSSTRAADANQHQDLCDLKGDAAGTEMHMQTPQQVWWTTGHHPLGQGSTLLVDCEANPCLVSVRCWAVQLGFMCCSHLSLFLCWSLSYISA